MADNEIVSGQQFAWCLINKLGEGDAGEVYQVESLVGARTAILKRPARSAFSGEIFRQSAQIRTEGKVLKALAGILAGAPGLGIQVPALLDESKPGTSFQDRNFIVIEKAPGVDLSYMARLTQLGLPSEEEVTENFGPEGQAYLRYIAESSLVPARILVSILYRLMLLLEQIHTAPVNEDGAEASGILWNDVKPDHLFWDPRRGALTIIDWGNARFLAADRTTSDRKFSWADDYRQMFEEMGRFLGMFAPDLQPRLGWPGQFTAEAASPERLQALKERLEAFLLEEDEGIKEARARESSLLQSGVAVESTLAEIDAVQRCLLEYGELPDYTAALGFAGGYATRLAIDDLLAELRDFCPWAAGLPGADPEQWQVVEMLSRIPGRSQGVQRKLFLDAIQAAIGKDWEGLLWKLMLAIQDHPEPDWWHDLTARVRRLALGREAESVRPLVALRRLSYALQAALRHMEDDHARRPGANAYSVLPLEKVQELSRRLREDAIPGWGQLEPGPPDCGLAYDEVGGLLKEIGEVLPEEQRAIEALLNQPKAQASQVLAAWDRKDFLAASQGLPRLLLWDPDRRRMLFAEHAMAAAPQFMQKIHLGPQPGQNFMEWITRIEYQARELRNQVGPAGWLDAILNSCRQIRKGAWPSDLVRSNPRLLREMPWLSQFERVERIPLLVGEEAEGIPAQKEDIFPVLRGMMQSPLGPEGAIALIEPLDAWMPEARGSSARVVLGQIICMDGVRREAAIKLMRMDQVHYALPLFKEEVQVLNLMKDVPGVVRLLECGFMQLDEGCSFPLVKADPENPAMGKAQRIGPDSAQEFLDALQTRIDAGWTPYLAIERQAQEDSLLLLCDAGLRRGQYLPVLTLLQMGIQICDILQVAHQRNIVYRDHKILHYYWKAQKNGLYMIDWNVARYHPEGLTQMDIHMDIVQFAARGLHHILTGRTAPGALALGPTRPEDIEQAAQSYQTQWTYDDQRLSAGLRGLLERALAGDYSSADSLGTDLKRTMIQN